MTQPRSRVGRPPGPHDDTLAKLLPTALRLFVDEGATALTPTRLHQETGVARATIYRNWPQPADLIEVLVESSVEASQVDVAAIGGFRGELRRDLHAAMEMLRTSLEEQPVRAFFAGCLEYGRRSEQVAEATERYGEAVLAPFDAVLTAAVGNGEIDGDIDALVAEVAGPVLLQHVLLGRPVSRHQSRDVVDRFLLAHTSR